MVAQLPPPPVPPYVVVEVSVKVSVEVVYVLHVLRASLQHIVASHVSDSTQMRVRLMVLLRQPALDCPILHWEECLVPLLLVGVVWQHSPVVH